MRVVLFLILLTFPALADYEPYTLIRHPDNPSVVRLINNSEYYKYCWISSNYFYYEIELPPHSQSRWYNMGQPNFITYNCEII